MYVIHGTQNTPATKVKVKAEYLNTITITITAKSAANNKGSNCGHTYICKNGIAFRYSLFNI